MKMLITGNMGYVGPLVAKTLRESYAGAEIIGFDSGFFSHVLTDQSHLPEVVLCGQRFGDIRKPPRDLFDGVDIVVHLAAISNDPIGQQFETVTKEINADASVELARRAKTAGVSRFVFASSCSMYGAAKGDARRENDELNPLTAYARSKVRMEQELEAIGDENFIVTNLRFATACGMSPRLRLDLVLNDFVACALSSGTIEILSDGTPWRPLIDVKDMARAIEWATIRSPENGGNVLSVNVGRNDWNYQVHELARAVADAIPGVKIKCLGSAGGDQRSYKVDFTLFETLAPDYLPRIPLSQSINEIREGLSTLRFKDSGFRDSMFMRLNVLLGHIKFKRINAQLYWV